jgi:P4 family phage/plasmid primase-like protien
VTTRATANGEPQNRGSPFYLVGQPMNENAIHWPSLRAAVSLFMEEGTVIELRALGVDRQGTVAGYFDDAARMVQTAANLSGLAEGIYLTLNPVLPALLARANNRAKPYARSTTGDDEVVRRRWMVIDIDPIRPKGISSTEAEYRIGLEKAQEVRTFLREAGWPEPIVASSGNGSHILYRIECPNSPEARDAIRDLLRGLATRFDDRGAQVDCAMFNASRICRLYGTQARKGDATDERPHRISRLITVPQDKVVVPLELIRGLANTLLSDARSTRAAAETRDRSTRPISVPEAPRPRSSGLDIENLDVVRWFQAHESYGRVVREDIGQHAVRCPWEADHSSADNAMNTDTTVWDGRDGRMPGFRCLHSHCVSRRIREVLAVWPDAIQFGARQRQGSDYNLTDDGNALRLVDRYGAHLRHCSALGGWLYWDGCQWKHGGDSEVYEQAGDVIREIAVEARQIGEGSMRAALEQHAIKSERWERTRAMVSAAAVKRVVQARPDQFDSHPYLLNCLNGVIDLRTAVIHPNRAEDHCTRQTNLIYNPTANCPRFDQFMAEVFAGNETVIEFVWRAIGYSLTGDVREQVLFFCYGSGSNGKSTLFEVMRRLLGDYAGTAAPGLLIEKRGDRHPTEVAELKGMRFVSCVETGEGQRLAEELVKRLTGGDLMKGRFMRRDFFSFEPTHKLWLSANHKPTIRGTDWAIWRRIPLVPFEVRFVDAERAKPGEPVKDVELLNTLIGELPGILAKAVRYAQEWCRDGLQIPTAVITATEKYKQEQDVLGGFLQDCCVLEDGAEEKSGDVYRVYAQWCRDNGEFCHPSNKFGMAMTERGIQRVKKSTVFYRGLRLLSEAEREMTDEPLMNVEEK